MNEAIGEVWLIEIAKGEPALVHKINDALWHNKMLLLLSFTDIVVNPHPSTLRLELRESLPKLPEQLLKPLL